MNLKAAIAIGLPSASTPTLIFHFALVEVIEVYCLITTASIFENHPEPHAKPTFLWNIKYILSKNIGNREFWKE